MYKSCNIIQHGLCFFHDKVVSCCFSPIDQIEGQIPPLLYGNYFGEIPTKEDLFERIHKYSKIFKQGGCPRECENCYHIEEKAWDDDDYINYITISHFEMCNAECIYCSNNCKLGQRRTTAYHIMPILKYFKEQSIIKDGVELHIQGGEFTIYKECDELLETFAINNFARVFVPTNAIKYSHNLFRAMNEATTYIIVSLDSGSRKTYKKIKRVDKFNKVIENLKKYGATEKSRNAIRLKYIIVPTYNDNLREFKKFLNIAKELGVKNIIIDIDARYLKISNLKTDSYFINLANEMNIMALRENFITEFSSFYFQNINNKEIKRDNFITLFVKSIKYKYFTKEFKELYDDNSKK
jgi:molybdenum cofactor biosynthesis enzyme MoaA